MLLNLSDQKGPGVSSMEWSTMIARSEVLELVCGPILHFVSSGLGLEPGPGSVDCFERTLPRRLPRFKN